MFAGGLSAFAVACSGDVESGAEPEDENLPLEGMPSAMTDMGSAMTDMGSAMTDVGSEARGSDSAEDGNGAAEEDTGGDDGPLNEGAPNASGLDGSGSALDADSAEDATLPPLEVPAGAYCEAVGDWDPDWVQFEEEVLLLVNEFRSEPADCGEMGQFAAAAPLSMDPSLRCSARLHSTDMFDRDYFDHDNLDGIAPAARMMSAGFQGSYYGENIAQGYATPEQVMLDWMESDGHCANIMRQEYTLIGIGYAPGASVRQGKSHYWTQNFGAPRAVRQRP